MWSSNNDSGSLDRTSKQTLYISHCVAKTVKVKCEKRSIFAAWFLNFITSAFRQGPTWTPTSPTLMMIFSNDFLREKRGESGLTFHSWETIAVVVDLWGTDIIAELVNEHILWMGQMAGQTMRLVPRVAPTRSHMTPPCFNSIPSQSIFTEPCWD